jgi:hypothetical protein
MGAQRKRMAKPDDEVMEELRQMRRALLGCPIVPDVIVGMRRCRR